MKAAIAALVCLGVCSAEVDLRPCYREADLGENLQDEIVAAIVTYSRRVASAGTRAFETPIGELREKPDSFETFTPEEKTAWRAAAEFHARGGKKSPAEPKLFPNQSAKVFEDGLRRLLVAPKPPAASWFARFDPYKFYHDECCGISPDHLFLCRGAPEILAFLRHGRFEEALLNMRYLDDREWHQARSHLLRAFGQDPYQILHGEWLHGSFDALDTLMTFPSGAITPQLINRIEAVWDDERSVIRNKNVGGPQFNHEVILRFFVSDAPEAHKDQLADLIARKARMDELGRYLHSIPKGQAARFTALAERGLHADLNDTRLRAAQVLREGGNTIPDPPLREPYRFGLRVDDATGRPCPPELCRWIAEHLEGARATDPTRLHFEVPHDRIPTETSRLGVHLGCSDPMPTPHGPLSDPSKPLLSVPLRSPLTAGVEDRITLTTRPIEIAVAFDRPHADLANLPAYVQVRPKSEVCNPALFEMPPDGRLRLSRVADGTYRISSFCAGSAPGPWRTIRVSAGSTEFVSRAPFGSTVIIPIEVPRNLGFLHWIHRDHLLRVIRSNRAADSSLLALNGERPDPNEKAFWPPAPPREGEGLTAILNSLPVGRYDIAIAPHLRRRDARGQPLPGRTISVEITQDSPVFIKTAPLTIGE